MESKSNLRTAMRRLSTMQHPDDAADSERIWAEVERSEEFREASTVLVYMSMPGEVPTREFIGRWCSSKTIALPRVKGDDLELRKYSPDSLEKGYLGIEEPSDDAQTVRDEDIGLALVPGVAFDRSGGRLGHGKGFYDRLLPRLGCPLWGICFPWRVVESVPLEDNDIRMDRVVY